METKLSLDAIRRNLKQLPPEEQKKLSEGMKNIPARQIHDQAQYLNNIMLPKIAEKRGEESADYKFYRNVLDSLLWAILILDRHEFLKTKYIQQSMLTEFYRDANVKYEKELQKYTTLEDLALSRSLDDYNKSIIERAKAVMEKK